MSGKLETETELKRRSKTRQYARLLEELRGLLQKEKEAGLNLLRIKHSIGSLILSEKETLGYGDIFEFLKGVAKDLSCSWGELYRCVRFAEKYPSLQTFLDQPFQIEAKSESAPGELEITERKGADLSWHEVANSPGVLIPPRSGPPKQSERVSACIFNSPDCAGEVTTVQLCAVDLAEFETWRNERKASK